MTYSSSSSVVTTTSIILCLNKHRLTRFTRKMAVKTERESWVTGGASGIQTILH